jgi:hypothetical protein
VRRLLLALILGGCAARAPAEAIVAGVRDLGPLPFAAVIKGRDGGHSARFGGRSVWAFGDTILDHANADGTSWLNSTFTTTADSDAGDGLSPFIEPLDATGAPSILIPWTAEEAADNTQDPKWVIWPAQIAVDPASGEAVLFYIKFRKDGEGGSGILRWRSPDEKPQRISGDLIFPDGDAAPTSGSLVDDGWLYAYDCSDGCRVGRARFSDAQTRSAWSFFDGTGWVAAFSSAARIMDTSNICTVFYSPYLSRFVALYSGGHDTAALRTSPRPEGPWSDALTVVSLIPPVEGDFGVYDVIAHAELSTTNKIYFSYSRSTAPFRSEMRLLEVTFGSSP